MATAAPARLILASGSSARQELMRRAGYTFDVIAANIDEPTGAGVTDIRRFVQEVAWRKAAAVAPRIDRGIVIAADTVGWIGGQVIGKPEDSADARRILKTLGGTEHELWTGVTLWRRPDDLQLVWQERSRVFLRAMDDAEMGRYLATREWRNNSGAYAIKEDGDPYLRVVEGTVSNVIGLPLETTLKVLPWFAGPAPSDRPV